MQSVNPATLRAKLKQNPEEIKQLCEAMLQQAGVTLPEDYDLEVAFADVLTLGLTLGDDPKFKESQKAIGRLALWMFRRLPEAAGA